MNKYKCLADAIEITKAYASSSNHSENIQNVLENVYEMLKKLSTDAENENN